MEEVITRIKGLDFLLSFKCTAKCLHCCNNASSELSGVMSYKDAKGYLLDLTSTQEIKNLVIHGGEPILFFNLLCKIIEIAKENNIPKIGIITNCYWAHDQKYAKKKLKELHDAGLNQLTLSADYFHQQFIPLENIRNVATTASEMEYDEINVDSYFIDPIKAENMFNKATKEIIQKIKDLDELQNVKLNSYSASFFGRVTNLVSYVKTSNKIPDGKCPLPYWIDGSLEDPKTIEIDHNGNVTLCPGICIGNTRTKSIIEILDNYDCKKHPILSIVNEKGPIGLFELVKEKGFEKKTIFVDECHLCYELRKEVRVDYPKELAPLSAYMDK